MISYLSLIFILVVLTGGISSALLLSSLTNSGKVIVLTVYFVLLLIVIIGFTISKVEELIDKQRKEVLETSVKSLGYTKDIIEVLKSLSGTICQSQDMVTELLDLAQQNKVIIKGIGKLVEEIRGE